MEWKFIRTEDRELNIKIEASIIILVRELMPLSEMDDLSWGLDLTGVLVGEIKERADPGLVKLQIVRNSTVDVDLDKIVSADSDLEKPKWPPKMIKSAKFNVLFDVFWVDVSLDLLLIKNCCPAKNFNLKKCVQT